MTVKLLIEQNLEFLSLKGGCKGSSESRLVKMPHCWKSHATAHIIRVIIFLSSSCSYVKFIFLVNFLFLCWNLMSYSTICQSCQNVVYPVDIFLSLQFYHRKIYYVQVN